MSSYIEEKLFVAAYLEPSKENVLGEYDGVTLTMLYLKVLCDMVSQNFYIDFSDAAIMF